MTDEKERKAAAERKRKQREHEKRLGMKGFTMNLARGERALIAEMAKARGFDDQTEYVFGLVVADSKSSGCDLSRSEWMPVPPVD